ncbi:hypothetical protein FQA39_LY03468 [Lamprigera yunnana]|nr:hypothetical protein FQA39_LY03468 [Lamprigera yunnana]
MIEISGKLIKGYIYLIGEVVECNITFFHPPSPSHKISQSNDDVFESLAWASAQINCQCSTNIKLNKTADTAKKEHFINVNDTALPLCTQENGQLELATKPKILFCDLRLLPGQSKTYNYKEKIPNDSPPSYRGQLVKYSYKLIIGTQRVNSPIKLLKIPLRVLPIASSVHDNSAMCNDTTEDLAPANPFLEVRQQDTPFELALQTLQNITARRKPNFYMISNTWGKVARFCLFKPAYKLGEDIIGTFDFSVATVTCVQLSVSLQCEENTTIPQGNGDAINQSRIVTFNKQHDVCLGLKYTQLVLPTPLHITPDFKTSLMSLRWQLHFEFVTSTNKGLENSGLNENEWQAPADLSVETMVWSLPIQIFSTTPAQVVQGLQINNAHRLLIR